MAKIGRNEPCPCGSGNKYKRCHGNIESLDSARRAIAAANLQRHEANEQQRVQQQGLGKPIISAKVGQHRVVAVGNTVHFAESWKTFPDFLMHYSKITMGREWGTAELHKSEEQMHPVALWYRKTALHQAAYAGKPGEVFEAPETGATRAYLELAYNLYLLEHNAELRNRLIRRLKNWDQFSGALSEIRVAGMFVRAGYTVKFDDEDDSTRTHCEYDVVRQKSGKGFSVEVKTRHWDHFPQGDDIGKEQVRIHVGRLLRQALVKQAAHERIVFIELAMPDEAPETGEAVEPWWMQSAVDGIKATEQILREQDKATPSTIVIVSNHPHRFHLGGTRSMVAYAVDGIGPTDFRKRVAEAPGMN